MLGGTSLQRMLSIDKEIDPTIGDRSDQQCVPTSVRSIRVLGKGRAARAELVDATMPNGQVIRCVEKIFQPGLLTRLIYRLGFQSAFAYQRSENAILASFYRRRVAAKILEQSDNQVAVAEPLYVRFDQASDAWVLAARWIRGRGVCPEPARPHRMAHWIRRWIGRSSQARSVKRPVAEIAELVATMHDIEDCFVKAGLYGSGWQVSPRAMVSTANLLRTNDSYTVIDLESGIPAILDPRYLLHSLLHGAVPPFDDLDAKALLQWCDSLCSGSATQCGVLERLRSDVQHLISHTDRWKNGEVAVFRRPWRLLRGSFWRNHLRHTLEYWRRIGTVDSATFGQLPARPFKFAAIWVAAMLPGAVGRHLSRMIGRRESRTALLRCLRDRTYRNSRLDLYYRRQRQAWIDSKRVGENAQPSFAGRVVHQLLSRTTPCRIHRLLTDSRKRGHLYQRMRWMLFDRRYRERVGNRHINRSIDRWLNDERITSRQASRLRRDLRDQEIRVYTQGLGTHLALKALAPVIVPAKLGGLAAFAASGNGWFLLPWLLAPLLRTLVTCWSFLCSRSDHVPHAEALMVSWLPTLGSAAFPLQMFASRPRLSTFLIRDAASRIACRIPIYGGKDSRTELAVISATDFVVEAMHLTVQLLAVLRRAGTRRTDESKDASVHEPATIPFQSIAESTKRSAIEDSPGVVSDPPSRKAA